MTPTHIVFGSPTVVTSSEHLVDQPLLFTATYDYQQIEFDLARGSPDYTLEFDFETRNLSSSTFAFTVLFDTPIVQNFSLHGLGFISAPNVPNLPVWTDNEFHHLRINANLTNETWTLQLDDDAPTTGPFYSASGDVWSIRFNLGNWRLGYTNRPDIQVAIDNIRISTSRAATRPSVTCPPRTALNCVEASDTYLNVRVQDTSGHPVDLVWSVDDVPYQTNHLASETIIDDIIGFRASFEPGVYSLVVSASNGQAPDSTCSTLIDATDMFPPSIHYAAASPRVLNRPNHRMVPVTVVIASADNCGRSTCNIASVTSNEPIQGKRFGNTVPDWEITGPLTVRLRAEAYSKTNRVYSILLRCADESGNISERRVPVTVRPVPSKASLPKRPSLPRVPHFIHW